MDIVAVHMHTFIPAKLINGFTLNFLSTVEYNFNIDIGEIELK
jgi:hypothetical protein